MSSAKSLISELLRYEVSHRIDAAEAANHNFFRGTLMKNYEDSKKCQQIRDNIIITNLELFYVKNK